MARGSNIAVIFRRGPTKWWRIIKWDTRRDRFEPGQWFHGHMYPDRSDLSPDGKLLVYFAGKFRARDVATGYSSTWTAVSKPPYLTALALWPIGDTWGGGGVFIDDRTLQLEFSGFQGVTRPHPRHPAGPLRVSPADQTGARVFATSNARVSSYGGYVKTCDSPYPQIEASRRRKRFTISRDEEPITTFEAHWAGWDQRGRLVATVGGRVFAATRISSSTIKWRELMSASDQKPEPIATPGWAQRW